MLNVAVVLFALAAVGGVVMLARRGSKKSIPLALPILHGLFAATALVMVILGVVQGGLAGLGTVAVVLFVGAALAGFYLFSRHLRDGMFPMGPALIHGSVAALAFVLLLVTLYL